MPNALLSNMNEAAAPGTNVSPGSASGEAAPGPPMTGAGAAAPQKTATIDQVKTAIKKQSEIDHRLRALLESGKPVEKSAAVNLCVDLVAKRVFTAEEMAGYLTTLPDEPQQVREWLEKHAQSAEQNLDKLIMMIHGQEAAPPEQQPGAGMENGGNLAQ